MMEFRPILLSLKQHKAIALLIIIQVALTMGVLSNSLLVTMATLKEWNLPSGIEHQKIISVRAEFYQDNINIEQSIIDDINRLTQLPEVTQVTPVSERPFDARITTNVYINADEQAQGFPTNIFDVNEHGADVLGLHLIAGRFFTANEVVIGEQHQLTPPSVVLVSQDMAKALFSDESAVGKTLWLAQGTNPVQIIGVYSNFMNGERLNGMGMSYHTVLRPQVSWSKGNDPAYLIRTNMTDANPLLETVRDLMYQTQGRYVSEVETLSRTQKRMYDGRGSRALTFLVISFVLVLITGFGLAGLMSFTVNQRIKQIGTRRALGATKWQVVRYFLLENSVITSVGLVLGFVITLSITLMLTEQGAQTILNLGYVLLTALLLFVVNTLAVYLPARKAANIEPAIVTRGA